jgi:hypothetical protein
MPVAVALPDLPKYLVVEPRSTIRMEMLLAAPACEIDVELDNPREGRSYILLIGHKGGPFVQRVRLAGKARIYFDPQSPGEYVLLLSNPEDDPIVLRLRARDIGPKSPRVPTIESGPAEKRPGRRSSKAPTGRSRKTPRKVGTRPAETR